MEALLFDVESPRTRAAIVPRVYQNQAHDKSLALFDQGIVGVLLRMFTGAGKTLVACLIADTWLRRGDNYRVMVVSYETQLVNQFAQEIDEYLGIQPGIEMEAQAVRCGPKQPRIIVASRASLLPAARPTQKQISELAEHGIGDLGACPSRTVETYLHHLRNGGNVESVMDDLEQRNARPEAYGNSWSRVHKFDPKLNWLIIFDEAHRHAYKLTSVGHLVDWFGTNPASRRLGLTATPKRGDGVSIGDTMFPGIAIDYPLYSVTKPCAVKDGFAVPYVQRYIEVEGVDFKNIKRASDGDFDEPRGAATAPARGKPG